MLPTILIGPGGRDAVVNTTIAGGVFLINWGERNCMIC
jgi:hypothetical protein